MKFNPKIQECLLLGIQALILAAIAIWAAQKLLVWLFTDRPIIYLESYVAGTY